MLKMFRFFSNHVKVAVNRGFREMGKITLFFFPILFILDTTIYYLYQSTLQLIPVSQKKPPKKPHKPKRHRKPTGTKSKGMVV